MTTIYTFATLDLVRPFHGKLAIAGFIIILLIAAFLLPLKKASYAQNSLTSDPDKEIFIVFRNRPTVRTMSALSNTTTQEMEFKNGVAGSNAIVFSVTSGDIQTAISELSASPDVAVVFPNYKMHLLAVPNDPRASSATPQSQWNLYKLNLAGTGTSAWNVTTGSTSVIVAVVDTGVDSSHPDFKNADNSSKFYRLVDCSSDPCQVVTSMTDAHAGGHGTHVAGLVAAATNNGEGIASVGYNTKVMVVKVASVGEDNELITDTNDFFRGITYAADNGAKIINTSYGIVAEGLPPGAINEYNNTANYAWERGSIVVAAAGNCAAAYNGNPACAILSANGAIVGYAQNAKMYPAASPNVISVAATNTADLLTAYSEHNDSGDPDIGNWVDVAAPGGDGSCDDTSKTCILSTVPGATNRYWWQAGTSMAAPQVAGVAALVWAAKPTLTKEQVQEIIIETANDNVAGTNYGLVNALAAVQAAVGTQNNTTPTPTPTGVANLSGTPVPSITGSLTPTESLTPTSAATTSATPTITPTAGPTATPTVTPYPTTPPRLPKTRPPNAPSFSAPYCPQTVSGVSDNSTYPQSLLSNLFVKPVYAQNCQIGAWRYCTTGGNPGCQLCNPQQEDWGVCATQDYPAHCSAPVLTNPPQPTAIPTTANPTSAPTSAVTITSAPSVTPGGPSVTTQPTTTVNTSSCAKKSQGDANCDGVVNMADFNFWLQEFDTMVPASPPNQNANYACVEGNTQTYFVDLSDFEIWRRNTTSGLISSPPQVGGPTQTPGGTGTSCVNTGNCAAGLCCTDGSHTCQPTGTAGITCLSGTAGTNVSPPPSGSNNSSNQESNNKEKEFPGDKPTAKDIAEEEYKSANETFTKDPYNERNIQRRDETLARCRQLGGC